MIARVASGAGVAATVGEGRGVGVDAAVTVGGGVCVARGARVSGWMVGAGAARDGAPQALNPISAVQHITSQVFQCD